MESICILIIFLIAIWIGAYSYVIYSVVIGYQRSKGRSQFTRRIPSGTKHPRMSIELMAIATVFIIGLATSFTYPHENQASAPAASGAPSICGVNWCLYSGTVQHVILTSPALNLSKEDISSLEALTMDGHRLSTALDSGGLDYGIEEMGGWDMIAKKTSSSILDIGYGGYAFGERLKTEQCFVRITTKEDPSVPIEILTFPTDVVDFLEVIVRSTRQDINISVMINFGNTSKGMSANDHGIYSFDYALFNEQKGVERQDRTYYPRTFNGANISQNFHLFSIPKKTLELDRRYILNVDFAVTAPDCAYSGHIHNIPFVPADLPISKYGGE